MITYKPFYNTIKKKNISTYKLINEYNISRSLLDRLKHNKPISSVTINDLCEILDCSVEDIVEYVKNKPITESKDNVIKDLDLTY